MIIKKEHLPEGWQYRVIAIESLSAQIEFLTLISPVGDFTVLPVEELIQNLSKLEPYHGILVHLANSSAIISTSRINLSPFAWLVIYQGNYWRIRAFSWQSSFASTFASQEGVQLSSLPSGSIVKFQTFLNPTTKGAFFPSSDSQLDSEILSMTLQNYLNDIMDAAKWQYSSSGQVNYNHAVIALRYHMDQILTSGFQIWARHGSTEILVQKVIQTGGEFSSLRIEGPNAGSMINIENVESFRVE